MRIPIKNCSSPKRIKLKHLCTLEIYHKSYSKIKTKILPKKGVPRKNSRLTFRLQNATGNCNITLFNNPKPVVSMESLFQNGNEGWNNILHSLLLLLGCVGCCCGALVLPSLKRFFKTP